MAHINFVIPTNRAELLNVSDDYYVRNVVVPKDLGQQLKNSRQALKDEGAEFIIDDFDTYYSVLHHGDSLSMDVLFRAYEDLHKATLQLNKAVGFLLEDKDSLNDETRMKYLTVLKMLLYLYTQIILMLENKNQIREEALLGGKKSKNKDELFTIDRKAAIVLLNNIIQRDISLFWDPPVVEDAFLGTVSEVCYRILQNPAVKGQKEVRQELFNLIGTLIRSYNHGTTVVVRMVQLIKMHEHLTQCLPEGVQQLVETFNCRGMVHDLIREMTEWQTDEKYQDNQGAKYCGGILSSMAVLMPDLMIPEVMYLNKYLAYDSAMLRNSVLSVIAEVVVNVLTNHTLTEEQKETRDEFLAILMDHMDDVSALVRSKVMQHWARMQKESAIPLKYQHKVLAKVVDSLYDKAALVRRYAANCVTTFLTHNSYSAQLSLSAMKAELQEKQKLLNIINEQFENLKMKRLMQIEESWKSICHDLEAFVVEELKKDEDMETEDNATDNPMSKEQISEIIRIYLNERKFKEAFKLLKIGLDQVEDFQEYRDNNQAIASDMYLVVFRLIFISLDKLGEEVRSGAAGDDMTAEDFEKMQVLENVVEFLSDCVSFLTIIDGAVDVMGELLETTAISDMHEAVDFFVAAYQFKIDNATRGILAMLRMMKRNEQDRKDHILKAFQTIYLNTDSDKMEEHRITIVRRLIDLVRTVPTDNYDDLELIIQEWTAKGVLDNGVVDMLWQYFTKKAAVSDDDARASVELLRMCALGRKTIITKNLALVATLAFGERGERDMLLLGAACELLAVAGREKIDVEAKQPPFKMKPHDEYFQKLVRILVERFFEPVEYYNKALFGAITFIYKMCSKPERLCEDLLEKIVNRLAGELKGESKDVDKYILMRLCQTLGFIALKHLEYLDETVYKELKRRNNIREERKHKKGTKERKSKARRSALTVNESNLNSSVAEESTLEGALAEDTDAEFILNVLENDTVTGSGGLGKLAYIIRNICERPDIYGEVMLQGTAVIALVRYMLVSSKFCEDNIRLLFTIFEKTTHPEVQCSILLHLSDLLTRFPNIIEPWTPRIYRKLKDPSILVRRTAFFTLSNLILRDMVRAHSHISEMACCMVDEDKEVREMCKTFFVNLSHKENNLYNVLPDIFSHLMELEVMSDDDVRDIMRFLFELMCKSKQMENLVDRFCCKFRLTEDSRQHRCIAYCLSLIQYNEKGLRKLIENFPTYKHLVHDADVYGSFKSIMQACSKAQPGKPDLKAIVSELEKTIASVFELNEDGNPVEPPMGPPKSKSTRKTRTKKSSSTNRKTSNKRADSPGEEWGESEMDNSEAEVTVRKSVRSRKTKQVIVESDSD